MNITQVFDHGDPVLITTFLILIGMSISSWYIIFWKAVVLRREHHHLHLINTRYTANHYYPASSHDTDIRGCIKGLMVHLEQTAPLRRGCNADKYHPLLTLHVAQALDRIRVGLDTGLTVLASIGSCAPFIGLFGTVWGIYGTLRDISDMGTASLHVVSGPIGEALIATAVGLFAAIPAVLSYNAFIRTNRVLMQDLRHMAAQLTFFWDNTETT